MTETKWLQLAIVFDLGECPIHRRPVKIEARDQLDESRLWIVKMHEWVLGKDSEWYWEPLPSSRTEDFINLTRFNSYVEAFEFWSSNVKKFKPLMIQ